MAPRLGRTLAEEAAMTPKDDLSADEPRPARPTFDVPPRIAEGTVIYLEQVVLPGLSIPLHEFEDGNGKIHRVDVPILQHIDHIFRRLNAKRAAAGLWPLDRGQLWFVLLNEFGPAAKTNTTDYWAYTWPKNLLDQWTQSWIGPPDDPVNSPPVDPPDDPVDSPPLLLSAGNSADPPKREPPSMPIWQSRVHLRTEWADEWADYLLHAEGLSETDARARIYQMAEAIDPKRDADSRAAYQRAWKMGDRAIKRAREKAP